MDTVDTLNTDWSMTSTKDASVILSSPTDGVASPDANKRLAQYGQNRIEEEAGRSRFAIFLAQFKGFLTYVLVAAALISAILGDWIEAVAILAIVVLNAIMGYVQESKAEEAMAALNEMAVPTVRVRRDGALVEISSLDVVPGDRVILETGNVVPADLFVRRWPLTCRHRMKEILPRRAMMRSYSAIRESMPWRCTVWPISFLKTAFLCCLGS